MRNAILLLAALILGGQASADPPTPPKPQPHIWALVGAYTYFKGCDTCMGGEGDGPVNVVIKKSSTHRTGHIYEAIIGQQFSMTDGYWVPDPVAGHIAKYKIDCKYHTYYEVWWYFVSRPVDDLASITAPVEWDEIKSKSPEEMVEKYLCKAQ